MSLCIYLFAQVTTDRTPALFRSLSATYTWINSLHARHIQEQTHFELYILRWWCKIHGFAVIMKLYIELCPLGSSGSMLCTLYFQLVLNKTLSLRISCESFQAWAGADVKQILPTFCHSICFYISWTAKIVSLIYCFQLVWGQTLIWLLFVAA